MKRWRSVLVIYDIEDTKNRNKVVKELESYGIRVQKSAFECYVDEERLSRLSRRLHAIHGENDSIRIYSNCECYDVGKRKDVGLYIQETVIL